MGFIKNLINKVTGNSTKDDATQNNISTKEKHLPAGVQILANGSYTSNSGKTYTSASKYLDSVNYAKSHQTYREALDYHREYLKQREESNKQFQEDYAENHTSERGTLDRIFGLLGYNGIAQALYNATDDDENTTFLQGLGQGFKYMNPFEDDVSDRKYFSDVFDNLGWESKGGIDRYWKAFHNRDSNAMFETLPDLQDDVNRGAIALAADIITDPLTYLNGVGAVSKVVKGTGYGLDTAKQIMKNEGLDTIGQVGKYISEIKDPTLKVQKLGGATANDFIEYAKVTKPTASKEEILEFAQQTADDFNKTKLKLRLNPNDSGFIPRNAPFSKRRENSLLHKLSTSKAFREFGDSTISPYYNSLAKKVRATRLGKMFSTNDIANKLAKGSIDLKKAVALHSSEKLIKGLSLAEKNSEAYNIANKIKEVWDEFTEDEKIAFFNSYEHGDLSELYKFFDLRDDFLSKAESGLTKEEATEELRKIATDEETNNLVSEFESYKNNLKELQDFFDGLTNKQRLYYKKIAGKSVEESTPGEIAYHISNLKKLKNINYTDIFESGFYTYSEHIKSAINKLKKTNADDEEIERLLKAASSKNLNDILENYSPNIIIDPSEYSSMTVKELKQYAKRLGLSSYSRLNKNDLIEALSNHYSLQFKNITPTEVSNFINISNRHSVVSKINNIIPNNFGGEANLIIDGNLGKLDETYISYFLNMAIPKNRDVKIIYSTEGSVNPAIKKYVNSHDNVKFETHNVNLDPVTNTRNYKEVNKKIHLSSYGKDTGVAVFRDPSYTKGTQDSIDLSKKYGSNLYVYDVKNKVVLSPADEFNSIKTDSQADRMYLYDPDEHIELNKQYKPTNYFNDEQNISSARDSKASQYLEDLRHNSKLPENKHLIYDNFDYSEYSDTHSIVNLANDLSEGNFHSTNVDKDEFLSLFPSFKSAFEKNEEIGALYDEAKRLIDIQDTVNIFKPKFIMNRKTKQWEIKKNNWDNEYHNLKELKKNKVINDKQFIERVRANNTDFNTTLKKVVMPYLVKKDMLGTLNKRESQLYELLSNYEQVSDAYYSSRKAVDNFEKKHNLTIAKRDVIKQGEGVINKKGLISNEKILEEYKKLKPEDYDFSYDIIDLIVDDDLNKLSKTDLLKRSNSLGLSHDIHSKRQNIINDIIIFERAKALGDSELVNEYFGLISDRNLLSKRYSNIVNKAESEMADYMYKKSIFAYTKSNNIEKQIKNINEKIFNLEEKYNPDLLNQPEVISYKAAKEQRTVNINERINSIKENQNNSQISDEDYEKAFSELPDDIQEIIKSNYYLKHNPEDYELMQKLEKLFQQEYEITAKIANERYSVYEEIESILGKDLVTEEDTLFDTTSHIFKNITDRFNRIEKIDKFILNGINTSDNLNSRTKELSDMLNEIFDNMAKEEVRVLGRELTSEELQGYEKLKNRYIPHILEKNPYADMELLNKKNKGQFNPDFITEGKKYEKHRTSSFDKSIPEANELSSEDKKFKTALHEIVLERLINSNKLIAVKDNIKYIDDHFSIDLDNIMSKIPEGYTHAVYYTDLNKFLYKRALGIAKNEKNLSTIDIFNNSLEELFENNNVKKAMYAPNVVLQKINDRQAHLLSEWGFDCLKAYDDNIFNITNKLSRIQMTEMSSKFMNVFDSFTDNWKILNTIFSPGFHVQNAVSNAFQSFLSGCEWAFNPAKVKQAYNILKLKDPKQTITLGGKTYTHKQIEHIAKKSGVVKENFASWDFGKENRLTYYDMGLRANAIQSFKDVDWSVTHPFKTATEAFTVLGSNIETTQRMNLFLWALDNGHTLDESVQIVDKFLFDYADITHFEKTVMKRIIPFYTFMRKNVPLELEAMYNRSNIFRNLNYGMEEFERLDEKGYVPENNRNEWRQDYLEIPYSRYSSLSNGEDNIGININLPYQQLDRLTIDKMIGSSNSLLKLPLEAIAGEYAYTGMDIDSPLEYLLGQTSLTSPFARMHEAEDKEEESKKQLSKFFALPIASVRDQTVYRE